MFSSLPELRGACSGLRELALAYEGPVSSLLLIRGDISMIGIGKTELALLAKSQVAFSVRDPPVDIDSALAVAQAAAAMP